MANGKWQMAIGKWQMANGKWQMVNGKWPSYIKMAKHKGQCYKTFYGFKLQ